MLHILMRTYQNLSHSVLKKIIISNQYGANLVFDADKAANLFGSIGIDETKTVIIYGGSFADWAGRRLPLG